MLVFVDLLFSICPTAKTRPTILDKTVETIFLNKICTLHLYLETPFQRCFGTIAVWGHEYSTLSRWKTFLLKKFGIIWKKVWCPGSRLNGFFFLIRVSKHGNFPPNVFLNNYCGYFIKEIPNSFRCLGTLIQTLGMLLDFWKAENTRLAARVFFALFSSLATSRVFGTEYPNTENH